MTFDLSALACSVSRILESDRSVYPVFDMTGNGWCLSVTKNTSPKTSIVVSSFKLPLQLKHNTKFIREVAHLFDLSR